MNTSRVLLGTVTTGFVLFTLGALREVADPAAAVRGSALLPTAMAGGACPTPKMSELARKWLVVSTGCTTDCTQTHLQKGDALSFAQDVSGADNFSVAVTPGTGARLASRTEGYTLVSDGVGNATGPIVFEHNKLDGSPLQLHWLIVNLRSFDSDGLGACQLRGRVQVCAAEPAKGATSCGTLQHAGIIHIEPQADDPPP